jgi:hypothetical protein
MPRKITAATSVENLKRQAKRWLKNLRAGEPKALARFARAHAKAPQKPVLRDVQHALALEYGFEDWVALTRAVEKLNGGAATPLGARSMKDFERLAADFVLAYDGRDDAALARLNETYGRSFTHDDLWAEVWRRVYAVRQRSKRVPKNYLAPDEARTVVAQDAGFGSWAALARALASGAKPVPPLAIDLHDSSIAPRRMLTAGEWDELIATMKERRLTRLDAQGMMTDAVLYRVADLDHVTSISLGGSRELTDAGLLHLARMPQLEHLNLSEYPGGKLTDRGLAVLAHLPNLRHFEMTWQRGVTDAGVANLKACERLERVDLMGSPTGDGAIEALQGKPNLRRFSTGKLVTDAGLPLLLNYPRFRRWDGPVPASGDDAAAKQATFLLVDGPFSDDGLATVGQLEGVLDLDLFWHVTHTTADGYRHLAKLPHLMSLGADGRLSDDAAMGWFARMPRLRKLRIQESAATDAGFEALGRSQSVESIWGRECPHFGSRGFVALSKMPALRGFGIGCQNVEDWALATLPQFPSLRELTPVGVKDPGFAHIGRCPKLERLTCMYCRDTTDAATEHVASLRLKYYYAGLTQITDRSLAILGKMESLEQVDLYECNFVTNAGVAHLAALPRLREVNLDSLPGVTFAGTRVFRPGVRVRYTT